MNVDYETIGSNIKEIRLSKHMTQDTLAEKCNVSRVYISQIERAKCKVSLEVLLIIVNVLGVTLDDIFLENYIDFNINSSKVLNNKLYNKLMILNNKDKKMINYLIDILISC